MPKQLKIIIIAAVAVLGLGIALFIAQPKKITCGHKEGREKRGNSEQQNARIVCYNVVLLR
jgi:hypothetical protein